MKTVAVSARPKSLTALFEKARRGGLILRSPECGEFILAEFDDFDREIELTRKNKALMKLLDQRGRQVEAVGLSEVKAQLDPD